MNAEIITIGDEILIGQIVDTNSQWIAKKLNKIGVSVYQISSVQDDKEHILNALKEAENRADIIIITGGLGPTKDDITKKTIAEYFADDKIIEYPEVIKHIKELFIKINHPFKETQRYQAQLPSKAILLKNELGTAPGMWFYQNDTVFISLPGIPYEMKGIMKNEVLPKLQKQFNLPFIIHKTIYTFGQGESIIAERIASFEDNLPDFIKLAYLPAKGKVRLRLSGKHFDKNILKKSISEKTHEIQQLIPEIVSEIDNNNSLQEEVGDLLKAKQMTVGTAESMTGGKLAATLVSVSGASAYFKGGFVVYSAELKEKLLSISKKIINKHSTVSKEIAKRMATSAKEKLKVDYALSVTGNAGPTTDKNTTNLGTVFIGIASPTKTKVYEFTFVKPREKIIKETVIKVLEVFKKDFLLKNNTK